MGTDRTVTLAATARTRTPKMAKVEFQSTVQSGTEDFSSSLALTAVRFACGQLGRPYVWGGNGDPGFDCSGLTHAAYAAAGIDIPRTAQIQYNAGPLLPMGTPLQPGDLVFFGAPGRIHHVGISLGGTLIAHAPDVNQVVQVEDYRDFPDLAGASRPTVRLTGCRFSGDVSFSQKSCPWPVLSDISMRRMLLDLSEGGQFS
jgi:cell wall-associated NlpC family hydrolase